MPDCDHCGTTINDVQLFECSFCGGTFCPDHRLPEAHDCPAVADETVDSPLGPDFETESS